MLPNLIGPELEKTGKLTKDKNVNEENKYRSENLIMLEKINHILPPSKIRMTQFTQILTQ